MTDDDAGCLGFMFFIIIGIYNTNVFQKGAKGRKVAEPQLIFCLPHYGAFSNPLFYPAYRSFAWNFG